MSTLTVEEPARGPSWRQFLDLPFVLAAGPPDGAWLLWRQRRRLTSRRHPLVVAGGEVAYFLARRQGRPVGRLTAHTEPGGREGRFGFLVIEGPDDIDVARALLGQAARWLAERGCGDVIGPMSFTAAEEAGVLIEGHDLPPVTGRAWTPPWYAGVLEAAGLTAREELTSYRLPASERAGAVALERVELAVPVDLAPFADPALMLGLAGNRGAVVAVPDVGPALGTGRVRGAWSLARRARQRMWEGCVITAIDGPEDVLVPALCAAAGEAGYRWVLSPWAPPGTAPVLRHRLYGGETNALGSGA